MKKHGDCQLWQPAGSSPQLQHQWFMVLVGGENNKHPHTCTSVDIPHHTWVVFFLRKRVEEDQGLVQPYRHLLWSNFNPMTSASSKKTSTSTGIKSFNHPYSYESKTAPLRQKWPERGTSPTYCLGFLNSDGIDLGLNESKKQTAPQKDGPTANRKFKFFQQKRNWSKVQGRSCYTWNISANTITICQSVLQGHCSCWLKH